MDRLEDFLNTEELHPQNIETNYIGGQHFLCIQYLFDFQLKIIDSTMHHCIYFSSQIMPLVLQMLPSPGIKQGFQY